MLSDKYSIALNSRLNAKRVVALMVLGGTMTACATAPTHADFLKSATQESQSIQHWENQTNAPLVTTTTLNQLIAAPALDALIAHALAANPSLQQTLLTLQIRQAEQRQALGKRLPEVDAGYKASKAESSTESKTSAQYTGSLSVSWEVDLWGKLANSDEAKRKSVEEQTWLLQAARDSLVSQVSQNWLSLIAQQHNIDIRQAKVASLDKNRQFIEERYRSGLSTLEDLDSVQTNLASAKATLESEKELLTQQQRTLATLIGSTNTSKLPSLGDYPEVLLPMSALPEQTLQRRPDLLAAYSAIEAADLSSKVAYKDLLPSLSLTAALDDVASSPSQALLTNPLWSLLAQLTAPLYKGGQLKAAADIADLQVAQAYQSYRGTLLTAVNEVEDALSLQNSLDIQYQHVSEALASAERNLAQYREKYREGLVTILDLLNIEQQMFDLQAQQNDLIYQRLNNRVTLSLALGLSWESQNQTHTYDLVSQAGTE
jgi:NodT family efflux transporter outer membrane factor (OMF) lipoprotein